MWRNRIIYLILFALSLVLISFYGGISYGFFFVMLMIPFVSFLYILCVIIRFKVYQRLDGVDLTVGRTSDFYFTLQNESLITFAGIRVGFYSSFSSISGLDDGTEYELSPRTGIKKQTQIVCRYRGEYEVGIKMITVQDFFRLFCVSYKNREPLRVRVKPAIVMLDKLCESEAAEGARDSLAAMTKPDVLVREYVPGDDVRMIHWKATAASFKLMTRKMNDEQQQGIGVIMGTLRHYSAPEKYLPIENRMIEAVLAVTHFYCKNNTMVATFLGDTVKEEDICDMRQFEQFYKRMSAVSFDEGFESEVFYDRVLKSGYLYGKKSVSFITHASDKPAKEFVKALCERVGTVTVYLIGFSPSAFSVSDISRCKTVYLNAYADSDSLAEVMG